MLQMNYGCGTTVHPRDLANDPTVLYVGVGGGMELLQFAYFSRRRHGVVGADVVDEMIARCDVNLAGAGKLSPWFARGFVDDLNRNTGVIPVSQMPECDADCS
jgi:hypothetical protein